MTRIQSNRDQVTVFPHPLEVREKLLPACHARISRRQASPQTPHSSGHRRNQGQCATRKSLRILHGLIGQEKTVALLVRALDNFRVESVQVHNPQFARSPLRTKQKMLLCLHPFASRSKDTCQRTRFATTNARREPAPTHVQRPPASRRRTPARKPASHHVGRGRVRTKFLL